MTDSEGLNKLNARLAATYVSKQLSRILLDTPKENFNIDDIKKATCNYLSGIEKQRWITGYQVGEVKQLWETWNFKQKAKWYLYNKTPVLKKFSDDYRELVSKHNQIIYTIQELELPAASEIRTAGQEAYEHLCSYKLMELPPHLISDPKTIVTDIKFKPVKSVDFISLNVEIKEPVSEAEKN